MNDSNKNIFELIAEGKIPRPPSMELTDWTLLELDTEAGTIRVQFDGKSEFANAVGTVNGGLMAAMLDDTMGPMVVATLAPGSFASTIELKTNFIRPAPIGPLIGEGRIVHKGRSIAFAEARLSDGEGNLLATGTATLRIIADALKSK